MKFCITKAALGCVILIAAAFLFAATSQACLAESTAATGKKSLVETIESARPFIVSTLDNASISLSFVLPAGNYALSKKNGALVNALHDTTVKCSLTLTNIAPKIEPTILGLITTSEPVELLSGNNRLLVSSVSIANGEVKIDASFGRSIGDWLHSTAITSTTHAPSVLSAEDLKEIHVDKLIVVAKKGDIASNIFRNLNLETGARVVFEDCAITFPFHMTGLATCSVPKTKLATAGGVDVSLDSLSAKLRFDATRVVDHLHVSFGSGGANPITSANLVATAAFGKLAVDTFGIRKPDLSFDLSDSGVLRNLVAAGSIEVSNLYCSPGSDGKLSARSQQLNSFDVAVQQGGGDYNIDLVSTFHGKPINLVIANGTEILRLNLTNIVIPAFQSTYKDGIKLSLPAGISLNVESADDSASVVLGGLNTLSLTSPATINMTSGGKLLCDGGTVQTSLENLIFKAGPNLRIFKGVKGPTKFVMTANRVLTIHPIFAVQGIANSLGTNISALEKPMQFDFEASSDLNTPNSIALNITKSFIGLPRADLDQAIESLVPIAILPDSKSGRRSPVTSIDAFNLLSVDKNKATCTFSGKGKVLGRSVSCLGQVAVSFQFRSSTQQVVVSKPAIEHFQLIEVDGHPPSVFDKSVGRLGARVDNVFKSFIHGSFPLSQITDQMKGVSKFLVSRLEVDKDQIFVWMTAVIEPAKVNASARP